MQKKPDRSRGYNEQFITEFFGVLICASTKVIIMKYFNITLVLVLALFVLICLVQESNAMVSVLRSEIRRPRIRITQKRQKTTGIKKLKRRVNILKKKLNKKDKYRQRVPGMSGEQLLFLHGTLCAHYDDLRKSQFSISTNR